MPTGIFLGKPEKGIEIALIVVLRSLGLVLTKGSIGSTILRDHLHPLKIPEAVYQSTYKKILVQRNVVEKLQVDIPAALSARVN